MAGIPVPDADPSVRLSGVIVLGALAFLAVAARAFRG